MAHIRTVKPEFFRHYGLYMAEMEEKLPLRIAFEGLWTAADREGRFRWQPESLKLDCLPYDKVDFGRVLDALTTRGFIVHYACQGQEYGCIPSFPRHQVINNRERPSVLPSPENSDTSTRAPRVHDACPTPLVQVKGEQGTRNKEQGRERNKEQRVDDACELGRCNGNQAECKNRFDQFWQSYPRHEPGRKETLRSWCKIRADDILLSAMISWISKAKESEQWRDPRLIPHATTFLNQRRWEGDPPPKPVVIAKPEITEMERLFGHK